MKQYDVVVFDWDGTVMNSTPTIVAAIQSACADLDVAVPSDESVAWIIGLSLDSALQRIAPTLQQRHIPYFIERYRHHFFKTDRQIALFDNAREMLAELKEKNVQLAVATGKSRMGLDRVLDAHSLSDFFDITRCADEAFGKPHPGMLHQVMDVLGVVPGQVLMVGDTTHDIIMAHNAGIDCVGVSYGAHDKQALAEASPVAVIDTLVQLNEWLRERTAGVITEGLQRIPG